MVLPEHLVTREWYDVAKQRYGEFSPVVPLDRRGRVHRIGFLDADTKTVTPAVAKYISDTVEGRQEIKAAQRFSGWVGPEIYSLAEVDENLELIMEAGIGTLQHLRSRELQTPDDQYAAACSLADLLATLEEDGHGHFDLKPQNILVCSDSDLGHHFKLVDFGRTMPYHRFRWYYLQRQFSIGTLGYLPPEHFDHERYCALASSSAPPHPNSFDMYAFGIIAYYLIKGTLPRKELSLDEDSFSARKKHAEIMRNYTYRAAILSLPMRSVHPKMAELIYQCTAPHPADRPRSFAELRENILN
ncbi:protein kinase [Candidatus Woesearchaeota archaeon]|nr:protein kinase [Candidatus Woesearchaeota archaeon]